MGFGNVGGGEILVILLVALLVLGPTKLPDVARQAGKAMAELRKVTAGFQREMDNAMNDDSDARARGAALAASGQSDRASSTDSGATSADDPIPADAAPSDALPATGSDALRPESDPNR